VGVDSSRGGGVHEQGHALIKKLSSHKSSQSLP